MCLLAAVAGCGGSRYVVGDQLRYPRLRDDEVQAFIPPRPGAARTAYLEAHRECAGIDLAYRDLARHRNDRGTALVLGLGVASIVLGVVSALTLTAASTEESQRSLSELDARITTSQLQASVDRQNALLWTGGLSGSFGGLLDLGALAFWLSWQHSDAFSAAATEVREAINESDRAVTEMDPPDDAHLAREAALLRRRCRRPQPAVPAPDTYLDGRAAAPSAPPPAGSSAEPAVNSTP